MSLRITRRDFLKKSMAVMTTLAVPPVFLQAVSRASFINNKAKRVIIIGAGLAGLTVAYELLKSGFQVTLHEARPRLGGRVYTLRAPFEGDQHVEGGAARIHSNHKWVFKYAKEFKLPMAPFFPSDLFFLSQTQLQRKEEAWRSFSEDVRHYLHLDLGLDPAKWFKIKGGNDLLVKAFARHLSCPINFDSALTQIHQDGDRVAASFMRRGIPYSVTGDYLVSTLPFSVLKKIDVSPPFPKEKQRVIKDLPYTSASRIFFQTKSRFWREQKWNGFGVTDFPMEIWDVTFNQPGSNGILLSYIRHEASKRVMALERPSRLSLMLDHLEGVYPGISANVVRTHVKYWDEDPWSLGGWCELDDKDIKIIQKPAGRVYFAGEHTSFWARWMEGAIESGIRVASEIKNQKYVEFKGRFMPASLR